MTIDEKLSAQLTKLADLCLSFHAKVLERGCPQDLADALAVEFLRSNLRVSAMLQMAMETAPPEVMTFPALKKK